MDDRPIISGALLDRLLHATGFYTVQTLAVELDWPEARVRQELARLEHAGCRLERQPELGIRLVGCWLSCWKDYLRYRLGEAGAGRILAVYARTASTQDVARGLVEAHGRAADGAVVAADEQTAGRGRLGRRWHAPAGTAVMFSRVCFPDDEDRPASPWVDRLTFAATVALAEALEEAARLAPGTVGIKWPNDLQINGKKIAGILVETFKDGGSGLTAAVVGVGINVDLGLDDLPPQEPGLRGRVTSLRLEGKEVDRLRVLAQAVGSLDAGLALEDSTQLVAKWRGRSVLLTHRVRLVHDGRVVQGEVVDLDPWEGLIVRTDSGAMVHLPAAGTSGAVDATEDAG